MTIKGDLAAALVSKGQNWDEARELLKYILDHAASPDFAMRYARDEWGDVQEYWRVIDFLKSML